MHNKGMLNKGEENEMSAQNTGDGRFAGWQNEDNEHNSYDQPPTHGKVDQKQQQQQGGMQVKSARDKNMQAMGGQNQQTQSDKSTGMQTKGSQGCGMQAKGPQSQTSGKK